MPPPPLENTVAAAAEKTRALVKFGSTDGHQSVVGIWAPIAEWARKNCQPRLASAGPDCFERVHTLRLIAASRMGGPLAGSFLIG